MDPRVHLQVAVERNQEPIRGTLADSAGTIHDFTGWLELMSAFDNARHAADACSEPPGDHA
jgi:hypothetical protein